VKSQFVRDDARKTAALPDTRDESDLLERLKRQEQEIDSLCMEVLERYEEATFVYRLSESIGSVLGESAIAGLVVREAAMVLSAHSCELWLKRDGQLVLAASYPDTQATAPARVAEETVATGLPWVRACGSGATAAAAVALPEGQGSFLGTLVLNGRPEGREYMTGEIKLMTAIAALAAAFIRNERLADKARAADARLRDDEIARAIHRGLLPRHDPLFAGLDVSGGFRAAEGVGGDYYGYVAMADGSLGVAIADVAGHGVGAALYMAIAKGALQSEARDILSAGDILGRVNEVLASDFSASDMFATLVFARFLPDGRRIVWSNAGHNPPILLRHTGEIETLKPCGPALGIVAGARWRDVDQRFAPGDVLLLYTDGLIEARDDAKRFFGTNRLIKSARAAATAAEIRENILDDLVRHTGTIKVEDDMTLVVVRAVPIEERS
jgi:serine phosphatase RsbU (regulator of sigma subunit)